MTQKIIPQVVVNLHVKYYKPQRDGTMERLIPCYSWGEYGQHIQHLAGVADWEKRPLGTWKSVGDLAQGIVDKMGNGECQEKI